MKSANLGLIQRTLDVGGCRAEVVSVTTLNGFENDVYLVETSDEAKQFSVVRLSHSGRKSFSEVRAELEFIGLLANAGIMVANPLGEPAELGERIGVWFEFVPGQQTATVQELTSHVAFELGQVMGQMHTAAEQLPSSTLSARRAWWEPEYLQLDCLSDVAAPGLLANIRRYVNEVRQQASGELLVHGDLQPGNVIMSSRLHVIDFDDSCRAEPEYDLAVMLIRLFTNGDVSATDIDRVVPLLIAGYRSVRSQHVNIAQVDHYARLLLLQSAIAACRNPGCPGLTASDALSRAWAAISDARTMPSTLQLAVSRVEIELTRAPCQASDYRSMDRSVPGCMRNRRSYCSSTCATS